MMAKDADQQTRIEWSRYDSRAHIYSDEQSIVRRLLRHPLFEADQVLESEEDARAVEGTFPIPALKFCAFKREGTSHAKVLPYDARQKREYVEENMMEAGADE